MTGNIATEYGCPACKAEGKKSQIYASMGKLVCSGNSSHEWFDSASFKALNPEKAFSVSPQFHANKPDSSVTIGVSSRVKQDLGTRYAGNLEATLSGFLSMMSEGTVMAVPESDLQRMKTLLGKIPESSGELFGLVYNLFLEKQNADEARDYANKQLDTYERRNLHSVVVDLDDDFAKIVEKSRDADLTPKEYVERGLKNALENDWL